MFDLEFYRSYYDDFYMKGDFRHYPESTTRAMLKAMQKKFFDAGKNILDLGCGTGVQMGAMERIGLNATGLDLSRAGLTAAKEKLNPASLIQGDALRLPFADNTFDAVVSFGCSLMNGSSPDLFRSFIREGLRVVKKSCWCVAITKSNFSGNEIDGWMHLRMREFREILKIDAQTGDIMVTLPKLFPLIHGFALSKIISACMSSIPVSRSRTILLALQK